MRLITEGTGFRRPSAGLLESVPGPVRAVLTGSFRVVNHREGALPSSRHPRKMEQRQIPRPRGATGGVFGMILLLGGEGLGTTEGFANGIVASPVPQSEGPGAPTFGVV